MILSIAWKNVWRNKWRSLIVIGAISLGLLGGIFYLAFTKGMAQQQINTAIHSYIANIQLHNPKYLINGESKYAIPSYRKIVDKIKELPEVQAVGARAVSQAMASSAVTGAGVMINGVDVEEEKEVSNIYSKIVDGGYFGTKMKNQAVIGKKLADKLNVRIHSKIVITVQTLSGDITYGAFRIAGIYKTDNSAFDVSNVFVEKKALADLIGMDYQNETTEIAVLLKHNNMTGEVLKKLKNIFAEKIKNGEIVIRPWNKIQPVLEMLNNMTIQFSFFFVMIILTALSFGIINTMLMAIMERTREIGMLMAIGMSRMRLFFMILIETVFLSVTGGAAGLFLSWLAITITGKTGIDLSAVAEGLNSLGYGSFVYPEIEPEFYFMIGGLVIVTALLASVYPARRALKMNPAEAVRHEA
ncbi:MAG: ABC transporter permease [Chlorobi bacterium]|nr:ABC transporter permease [Chlorobiota bacterium]